MKDYLEDRKIDNKYIRVNQILGGIAIALIMIMILVVGSLIQYKEYVEALILFIIFILLITPIIIIEAKARKKYNKIFKQRKAYYVFNLNKEYTYDDIVLLLYNIKKKKDKWHIEHENEVIFRLKYGFVHNYIYRINIIKYNNFTEDEYKSKVIKLNKEYTDKLGTDRDNYCRAGKYRGNWTAQLHRINFICSNELNSELEKIISKNAYYYMMSLVTSQTIIIIRDKMYIPSIRTAPGEGILKYTRTLNYVFKWFNIEAP